MDVLANAHAPKNHRPFGPGEGARGLPNDRRVDAANRRHALRREARQMGAHGLKTMGLPGDIIVIDQILGDDHMHHRVEQGDIGAGAELQHHVGVAGQGLAARVHHDQGRAGLDGVFEKGRGDRVVDRRIGADHHNHIGVNRLAKRGGDRPRPHGFHQRRDGGGVAQPGAMVDIVGAEPGAHQFLHQISLFIGAFGRAKAGQGVAAVAVADTFETGCRHLQGLFPAGFSKMAVGIGGIDWQGRRFRRVVAPDQRFGQPLRAVDIVETETPLDA